MARVETVVAAAPPASPPASPPPEPTRLETLIRLRPREIRVSAAVNTRPGPAPANDAEQTAALARNLRELGQIVPVVVEYVQGEYWLVDGRQRLKAALLLDSDAEPFYLSCATRDSSPDPLRDAIHANLRRRGYGHLQFAYLCAEVRKAKGWSGTKEVADYLGVSRAQVSQHDRLLNKPAGMSPDVHSKILNDLAGGGMAAEAAWYALSRVAPEHTGVVLDHAAQLAEAERCTVPAAEAETGVQQAAEPTVVGDQPPTPKVNDNLEPSRKRVKAKVERKHVERAARELDLQQRDPKAPPLQRTIADLRALSDTLRGPAYPDVMRSFVSLLFGSWWRGDAQDQDVLAGWAQVAMLVEEALERRAAAHPHVNPHNLAQPNKRPRGAPHKRGEHIV